MMTPAQALELAQQLRSKGKTFKEIAEALEAKGYVSSRNGGKPLKELSVRHMLLRAEERETGRVSPSMKPLVRATPPARQPASTDGLAPTAGAPAELLRAVRKLVWLDDLSDSIKLKMLQSLLPKA